MALTNRLGVVTWTLENDTITLSSSLANQKKLEDAVGMGFFEFMATMDSSKNNPLAVLATLFYHLQVGTSYTVDEIYGCFFANLSVYGDTFAAQQEKFINHLTGQAESKIIMDAQKSEEQKGKR